MRRRNGRRRILAIDPTHRGFGYVVLEKPDRLVDWGLCQVDRNDKASVANRVSGLIRRLAPDILVIEDVRRDDCRRGQRARDFLHGAASESATSRVRVQFVPAATIREAHRRSGRENKGAVARWLVSRFPELESLLPPERKAWMCEDERMAIFDALALARFYEQPALRFGNLSGDADRTERQASDGDVSEPRMGRCLDR